MYNALSRWYDKNKRPLPWRAEASPYAVLVSEVMAQQTRLAQLLPFYARFMAHFPTLAALARSDVSEVLAVWAGMGYYSRARNLHLAARTIRENYGEQWPATRQAWEALPGIGPYTAGAILSIAFGQREAAIDGNVLRLYARLENDPTDISSGTAKLRATQFVTAYMPQDSRHMPTFTQALMELGAMLCTPKNPRCALCPLAYMCKARQNHTVHTLPVKGKKKPSPVIPLTVLLIFSPEGKVLMHQREAGLLESMWVYYLVEDAIEDIPAYLNALGYTVHALEPLGSARHAFTHRIWQMNAFAVHVRESHAPEGYRFFTPGETQALAVPAAMKYFMSV
ncbi:MAG: A/G-specific adenine glycosylase [Defluviitaleaceae bacterium]|nr:A/G-specific adenine glycosylase [Defluviitaleaceae bacterium]MCL2240617.1 A/G-specific adenine glycosylase [Defluviitaleaceae bacterium]